MKKHISKKITLIIAALLIAAAVIYGFFPETIPVQTVPVAYGPMEVVIEEEGETRVEDLYVVYSPVSAFIRRICLEPGNIVKKDQPVAYLESPVPSILDSRSRAEAAARVEQAEAMLLQARERVKAAEALARFSKNERLRIERLAAGGFATPQAMEKAVAEYIQTTAELEASQAAVAAATADLTAAKVSLEDFSQKDDNRIVREILHAPESGRVLAVHRKSEGYVSAGEALLEIGDINRLEVQVETLSQDAVRVLPGMRVLLDHWGGDDPIEGIVSHVEPLGQTVVSALGVEEQRVHVIVKFVSSRSVWEKLGSGYRVIARFIVWENDFVLQVPTSAIFRFGKGWYVFAVENNRAVRKTVTLGQQAGLSAQVLEGLEEGDIVIIHPDSAIGDGSRVNTRWK